MKKTKVKPAVQIKAYHIISQSVGNGIAYGWNRAHKHTDTPDADYIKEQIFNAIMSNLCDILSFDDEFKG